MLWLMGLRRLHSNNSNFDKESCERERKEENIIKLMSIINTHPIRAVGDLGGRYLNYNPYAIRVFLINSLSLSDAISIFFFLPNTMSVN